MTQEAGSLRRSLGTRGQALIEFVLGTIIMIGVFSALSFGVRTGIRRIWKTLATEIAAGCPSCEPPEELR